MRIAELIHFLTFVGVAHATISKKKPVTFDPKNRHDHHMNLEKSSLKKQVFNIPRGGAGPLDPLMVAKVHTVAGLAQGFLSSEAPDTCFKVYGGNENSTLSGNEFNEAWQRTTGEAILSLAVSGFCLFFQETSVKTALAYYYVVWAAAHARAILTESKRIKFGEKKSIRRMWLPVACFGAYACFTDAGYAMTFTKVVGILTLLSFLYPSIDPATGAEFYGYKPLSSDNIAMIRGTSIWLLACGVYITALAYDIEPLKACGYTTAVGGLLGVATFIITDGVSAMELPVGPFYFWVVAHGIVAATLAI